MTTIDNLAGKPEARFLKPSELAEEIADLVERDEKPQADRIEQLEDEVRQLKKAVQLLARALTRSGEHE